MSWFSRCHRVQVQGALLKDKPSSQQQSTSRYNWPTDVIQLPTYCTPTFHNVAQLSTLTTDRPRSQLPAFSAPNFRSLGPKMRNFAEDMILRDIGVSLCSETWEVPSNELYQWQVAGLLQLRGLRMVSNPRKKRRGGGVCIVADLSKVTIQSLNVPNPHDLEIVWALVKPTKPSAIKNIITFAFYSPPRFREKSKLTDCILNSLQLLSSTYPQAGIMGGGDRNCYNVSPVLQGVPRFQNLQPLPTLGARNLDIFLSNMGRFYSAPVIVPPVGCDNPRKGVPSDHAVPILYPANRSRCSNTISGQQINSS